MKTGFNCNQTCDTRIEESGIDLLNKLLVYAVDNAAYYAKSAGRVNLSGKDMIIALQYEAHEFPFRNVNSSVDANLFESEEDDSDIDEDDDTQAGDDEFTRSESSDSKILKMNYYHDTWNSWEPQSQIESALKNAVNAAIQMYTD